MLNRNNYMEKIMRQIDSWKIKALVGIRGSGKTTLLNQVIKNIKLDKKADDFHIIYINLEHFEYEKIRDIEVLKDIIMKKITDDKPYYIFIEEIQYIFNFESLLNDFWWNHPNFSIFISCSTIRFTPTFLSPEFTEKYLIFPITPFTYSETCKILNTTIRDKNMLMNYLKYGGMPGRFRFKRSSEVKDFLHSALDSIYLHDIVAPISFPNLKTINLTLTHIMNQIGKPFLPFDTPSPDFLAKENITYEAYLNVIGILKYSFLLNSLHNYNVKIDKQTLVEERYYLGDLGLAFIRGFDLKDSLEAALKNLVYLELKQRGYELFTGINDKERIDFVAIHEDTFLYIHVVSHIEDGKSFNEEIKRFENFEAHGPKYILSLDQDNYVKSGVIRKNIMDFLLDDSINIIDNYKGITSY